MLLKTTFSTSKSPENKNVRHSTNWANRFSDLANRLSTVLTSFPFGLTSFPVCKVKLRGRDSFGAPRYDELAQSRWQTEKSVYPFLDQKKEEDYFGFLANSRLNFHILKTWWALEYALVFIVVIKKSKIQLNCPFKRRLYFSG